MGIEHEQVPRLPGTEDEVLLLHNPACSKSRTALSLLREHGIAFEERNYLRAPLTRDELDDLSRRLGRPPREWIRSGESAYQEAGLAPGSPAPELLDAMAARPILLERPIVIRGARAVVARPPEVLLDLLSPEDR